MDQRVRDLFMEACEAKAPLKLELRSSLKQHRTVSTLDQPYALVGREGEVDVCLPHNDVSRRHAYLQVIGGRVFCIDLMSRSGVHWPEERRTSGWMLPDQTLALGPFGIHLHEPALELRSAQPDLPSPLQTFASEEDLLPKVTLVLLGGTSNPAPWPMNRLMALVGRADMCRVQLSSSTVSSIHCALLRTRLGLWVVDLKGKDGVRVNGTHVHYARVGTGDVIEVGRFQVRVLYPTGEELKTELQPRSAPDYQSYLGDSAWSGTLPPTESQLFPALCEQPPSAPVMRIKPRSDAVKATPSAPVAVETTVVTPMMAIAEQFGQMQQQMFDQFQQAMMMMVQFFGTMHRDQMQVIRDELAQIRDLTAKLTQLQLELVKHPKPTAAVPPRPASATPQPSRPAATKASSGSQPRLAAASVAKTNGNGSSKKLSAPQASGAAAASLPSARPPEGVQSEQEVHAWLTSQIEMIQKERQTRWEKVLTFFTRQ